MAQVDIGDNSANRFMRWCFTINNPDALLSPPKGCKGFIYQLEIGDSGTPHYQGVIVFDKPIRFTTCKNRLPEGAHIEPARNWMASLRYCQKEETRVAGTSPHFYGTLSPDQPKPKKVALEEVAQLLQTTSVNEIALNYPGIYIRNAKGLRDYKGILESAKRVNTGFQKPNIIVLTGPSGCGKTRSAYEMDFRAFRLIDHKNFWFDGYEGQKTIILDEFRCNIPFGDLLIFLDGHGQRQQIKGGYVNLTHDNIIITSNILPYDWYGEMPMGMREPLYRRLRQFAQVLNWSDEDDEFIKVDLL